MLSKLQTKKEDGFTIIEVLIVLAIAGLIMLIVFLAVPALQRNQRNNARNSAASKVAASMTECLSNRNGIMAQCASAAALNNPVGAADALSTVSFGAAAFSQTDARVVTTGNTQCNPEGAGVQAGGGPRAFAVTFQLEGNIDRCIAS